jgi:hypothetical protein
VLVIHLAGRLTVARTLLPVASFADDGSGRYTAEHLAVSIRGATALRVFVDLTRGRVVWVMPLPPSSEGPPPTSIPPYTVPPAFVLGTAGASADDAAQGLVLHLATFDGTGRLVQEEWVDPLTGRAVTRIYDAERKLIESMSSVRSGSRLRVTTVSYRHRTWTSATGSLGGEDRPDVLRLDSRTLPARIRALVDASALAPAGTQTLDGLETARLHGQTGIAYWGLLFSGARGDLWVDPATYLPVEATTEGRTGAVAGKLLFSWQPRTDANAARATLAVPKAYAHVRSTGLPHIFGD